jgi:hypothetical protein
MPFEPGKSGNPNGTPGPKKHKLFREALTLAIMRSEGDKTKIARIAEALVDKAAGGDVPAIKEVADRLDGKAVQAIAGADGEGPLEVVTKVVLTELTAGDDSKD